MTMHHIQVSTEEGGPAPPPPGVGNADREQMMLLFRQQ